LPIARGRAGLSRSGEFAGIELRDPDGYWYGCMLTTLGIFYHRGVLARLGLADWQPQRWWDFTDERLAGYISAGDPRFSGSVHLLYEWILQVYGWQRGMELLLRLGANTRAFGRSSDSVSRDVVIGKAACTGTLDFYALTAMAREHEQVRRGWADSVELGLVSRSAKLSSIRTALPYSKEPRMLSWLECLSPGV
jgi:ABC-type Fe3+ transport system substrate-binding protein